MNSGSCFLKMQVYSVHSIPCICVGRHKLQQFQWASEACPFLPETMLFILASRWVFLTILAFFTATSKTFPPNLLQICRNKSIISWCFFITMPWKLPYFGVFLSCQVFSHLLEFCLLFLGFFSYKSCSAVFLLVFPSSCWKKRKHFWASEVGKKTNDFFTWWCEKLCSRTWQNVSILQWELMLLQKLLGFTLYNPGFSVSWNDRIFECYF